MQPTADASSARRPAPLAAGRLVWSLVEGHRGLYGLAALCLVAATAFNFMVPLVGSAAIDFALLGNREEANPLLRLIARLLGGGDFLARHLWLPGVAMIGFSLAGGLFSYAHKRNAAVASDGACKRLKDRLYDHIQRLPSRVLDKSPAGDLVQRCTSDVETLRLFLASRVAEIARSAILLLGIAPLMLLMDARLALVSFLLIPPLVLYGYVYFKRIRAVFKEVDEAEGALTAVAQENIAGVRVVRAFGRGDYEIARFAEPNQAYRDKGLELNRLMAWFWGPSELISLCQIGLVLFCGAYLVSAGQTTIGTLFAFLSLLNIALWPVRMMGQVLTELGKAMVAVVRIQEILDEPEETDPTRTAGAAAAAAPPAEGRVEFQRVCFAHAESSPTVRDVSFAVAPGETLAILGPSGAGKSTLMHLLLRFYDCDAGRILLDGRDLKELSRDYVRRQFGVVLQEPFLYARTIRENIRFSRREADDRAVEAAARAACIHDTILSFGKGYDTEIGERGITLSGGQRQRVAISRALLRDPPVLLLDDALSAVDSETEVNVIDALRRRRGARTTIVIAHRLSTLVHADRILVLEDGRVTQSGTHRELVRQEGLYRRLWDIQTRLEDSLGAEASSAS